MRCGRVVLPVLQQLRTDTNIYLPTAATLDAQALERNPAE